MPLDINPKLSIVAHDELFINLNKTDWGVIAAMIKIELFQAQAGIYPNTSIETGYLNQYVNTRNIDRVNYLFSHYDTMEFLIFFSQYSSDIGIIIMQERLNILVSDLVITLF